MSGDPSTNASGPEGTPTIKSVETSHRIVAALEAMGPATVTEVAAEADLSKGGAYKHLKTLEGTDFVVREGNEYRLGLRFLDLGGKLRYDYPHSQTIKDSVQQLAQATGETALYTVLEADRTTTLFRERGPNGVSTRTRIGKRLYPHETAAGKCILSQLSPEAVDDVFGDGPLPEVTEHTITDRDALDDELARVAERGYAYNLGESVEGLVAIAAPLVPDDAVLGACSVTGPYHRLKGDPLDAELTETLLSFVNELELNIAHANTP